MKIVLFIIFISGIISINLKSDLKQCGWITPVYYTPVQTYSYVSVPVSYYRTLSVATVAPVIPTSTTYMLSFRKDGGGEAQEKINAANPENMKKGTPEDAKKELAAIKKTLFGDENKNIAEFRNKAYDEQWLMKQLALTRALSIEDYLAKNDGGAAAPAAAKVQAKEPTTEKKAQP